MVGGRPEGVPFILQGGSPGGVAFRVGDLGPDPPHGAGPGKLPAQGRATYYREAAEATGGGDMGVSPTGGSNGGSGF